MFQILVVLISISLGLTVASGSSGEVVCYGPVKIASDILGFLIITSATLYIGYKNATYNGPSGTEPNFNGFREENMIALFINLFASLAYWARVISTLSCTRGFLMLTHLRYCDYLTTCPLLVLDLCWNLEAPYKCSSAALILITLLTGVACSILPAPQSYLWFGFGDIIFLGTYIMLLIIVRARMAFFVARARSEMAVKAMYYIKFACCCFFLIWIWFPLLWVISPYCLNYIDIEVLDLLHMFLDVCAKSVYGVVLLWFRWHYDKKLLRNVDEEEFFEFSTKCPERKSVMQVMVEDDDPRDGAVFFLEDHAVERAAAVSHGSETPLVKASNLAPTKLDAPGKKAPHGTGSRHMFASNRRRSTSDDPSAAFSASFSSRGVSASGINGSSFSFRPLAEGGSFSIRPAQSLAGTGSFNMQSAAALRTATQVLVPGNKGEGSFTVRQSCISGQATQLGSDDWLDELARALENLGKFTPTAIANAVMRLDESGVVKEQMRTTITDRDLQVTTDSVARSSQDGEHQREHLRSQYDEFMAKYNSRTQPETRP